MKNDYCRKTPKVINCDITEERGTGGTNFPVCEPFEICLPFGGSIRYDGTCLTATPGHSVADGTYGTFTVQNGCIVSAGPNPVFEYTPGPCVPDAGACGDGSGGGSWSGELATDTCNLLQKDASGRLGAFLVVEDGVGITTTGCGSSSSPLRISLSGEGGGGGGGGGAYITSADTQALTVTGIGSLADPYVIGLANSPIGPGDYGAFTIDSYGRIIGYTSSANDGSAIRSIVPGPGITVNVTAGVATIGMEAVTTGTPGTYNIGGYQITIDLAGRVTQVKPYVSIQPGEYDPSQYTFTIDEHGNIIGITPKSGGNTNGSGAAFTKFFEPNTQSRTMVINTNMDGTLRIIYRGELFCGSKSTTSYVDNKDYTTGIKNNWPDGIPRPFALYVDNTEIGYFNVRKVEAHQTGHNDDFETHTIEYYLVEAHAQVGGVTAGSHTIEFRYTGGTTPYVFPDAAVFDVSVVQPGQ